MESWYRRNSGSNLENQQRSSWEDNEKAGLGSPIPSPEEWDRALQEENLWKRKKVASVCTMMKSLVKRGLVY